MRNEWKRSKRTSFSCILSRLSLYFDSSAPVSFTTRHINAKAKKERRRIPVRAILSVLLLFIRPLYALGAKFEERRKREVRFKQAISLGAAAILALTIALLVLSLLIKLGGVSLSSAIQVAGLPLAVDERGVTNILLLGQGDETGQDLTDTIIIASIDPSTSVNGNPAPSVALLSLPRDLYFLHAGNAMETEKGKLNALWRDEKIALRRQGMEEGEAARAALRHLGDLIGEEFGIPVHHTVMVDFAAFEQAVDAIGGIDLDVPETIHDTEYPGPNYSYETFHIDAGRQHLDGKTALKYARTRSTTSDFDRSARQQRIIEAVLETMKESGLVKQPRKIMELYSILSEHLHTDLKTRQLVTLTNLGRDIEKDHILTLQLNNVNGLYGDQLWKGGILYSPPRELFEGEFVMLPVSIPEFPVTWKQIKLLMHLSFDNRELYLVMPQISILNAGAVEGSARKLSREFTKFGFEVVEVANVPDQKEFAESHVLYGDKKYEEGAAFFGKGLKIPPEELTEIWRGVLQDRAGDITVVLGEDFSFQYFQDIFGVE